jgi:UDP-N-acetylmuramate--alanine ligase
VIAIPGLFDSPRVVHLVGAGGVGMSSLGQALLHAGHRVSGSDARSSERTERLESLGARIALGHAAENLPADADLVVVTAAIDRRNPEVALALERGIHIVKYARALGELMAREHGVCVAGCHGKTTTTGLMTTVLVRGGLDPTMVLGGDLASLGGNFRHGAGRYFVAEACEFDRSFLNLRPKAAIVTNVDRDHLDYYRDLEEIQGAFRDFARLIPEEGFLATLNEHERIFRSHEVVCRVETFGLRGNADWVATDWRREGGITSFHARYKGVSEGTFELRLAGLHNICNCLAVLAVARHLKLDFDAVVRPALLEYRGVDRRMQTRYEGHGVLVLDDYAHHPREIAAVLSTLREEFPGRRIVAVFQPHQASRTRVHLNEFADALKFADKVFVPDIYLARDSEEDRRAVHAVDLVRTAANRGVDVTYVERFEEVAAQILAEIRVGDLVVTLGAGSVWEVSSDLADRLAAFDHQVIAP